MNISAPTTVPSPAPWMPEWPSPSPAPDPNVPPAGFVLQTYGDDLRKLGAVNATVTGPDQLTLRFDDARAATLADGVLRDTIEGVELVITGLEASAGVSPKAEDLARFAATRLDAISRYDVYEGAGMVTLWTRTAQDAGRLQGLINPTFGSHRVFVEQDHPARPLPHGVGANEG